MAPAYMLRHRPLITPRIAFEPAPPAPWPTLTTRTEFNSERLKRQRVVVEDPRASKEAKRPRRSDTPQASSRAPQDESPEPSSDEDDSDEAPNPSSLDGPSKLIPKPPGEPGRPSSGGFSLDDVLVDEHRWSKSAVEDLHKLVRAKAQQSLDLTVSFSKQNKQKIQDICDKVQERWPDLARYEDCWPVRSVLKLALKYRSESSRRAQIKADGERMRSAAFGP